MRDRVPRHLQELPASADMQPPFEVPATRVVALEHVRRECAETRLSVGSRAARIPAIAKLDLVSLAAMRTLDSKHAASLRLQCAYGNGPMPRSSTVRPVAKRSRLRCAATGCE